jgi:hypothetical protein
MSGINYPVTSAQVSCCGKDMRALLVVDGRPRLAVLICDGCRRRRWFRDGDEISAEEALETASVADASWPSRSVEAAGRS